MASLKAKRGGGGRLIDFHYSVCHWVLDFARRGRCDSRQIEENFPSFGKKMNWPTPIFLFSIFFFYFYPFLLATKSVAKISRKSYEAQLYEDLLFDYNKIARPVKNSTDVLHIDVGASLIRIIDVDEKNQVLTTNLWLEMRWNDSRLQWDPNKYGGIMQLHIPSTDIWIPDFVLYDNAAGDPDITIFTDALVAFNGRVFWQPPAIYKSFCPIKVQWFPYDKQDCRMKFGAWSYTGNYVDLHLIRHNEQGGVSNDEWEGGEEKMEMGMDLSFFYRSAEWDLMNLTSERHAVLYTSCCGPETYVDITYYLELRRKTLFFTCNLIIPCFLISFLTTFVFYLSDHKITFSISILVTLTVFFLVLIDLMPPTSLEVPMFGQYLITTMILVALSTMVSVVTVNIRFRNGATHQMSPWIRIVFLQILPKLLFMKRPDPPPKRELPEQSSRINSMATSPISAPTGFNSPNALASICPSLIHSQPSRIEENTVSMDEGKMIGRRARPDRLIELNHIGSPASLQQIGPHSSSISLTKGSGGIRPPPPPYSTQQNEKTGQKCEMCSTNSISKNPTFLGGRMQMAKTNLIGNGRNVRKMEIGGKGQGHPQQQQMWGNERGGGGMAIKDAKQRANEIIFGNLVNQVRFIAEYFRRCEEEAEISDDWTFVAMVLDRLFLVIFSILNMATFSIIISAPTLFDFRNPLNVTLPTRPLGQANLFSINKE